MPAIVDHIAINNKKFDRRYKITDKEREKIKSLHGQVSIRSIARMFPHISRRSIQFIIFPERKEKVAERARELKRWTKYNKKEFHTSAMRKYRKHKEQLLKEGKLTID